MAYGFGQVLWVYPGLELMGHKGMAQIIDFDIFDFGMSKVSVNGSANVAYQ